MKNLSEVVKIFDVKPFRAGDGDLFRFRLEVVHLLGGDVYQGRVYRLETYRLQPTFPQSEGSLPDWQNDGLIYVVDDMFDSDVLKADSVQGVIESFQQLFNNLFKQT